MKSQLFFIGVNDTLLNVRVCRTYRGAAKNSTERGSRLRPHAASNDQSLEIAKRTAKVFVFDPAVAPVVTDIDALPSRKRGETTDLEFAERQVVAWAQIAERLRKENT